MTMMQYLLAGALPSQAAPVVEQGAMTRDRVETRRSAPILSPSETFQLSVTKPITATGTGTVTSDPSGIECGGTCASNFEEGTVVTLTATAEVGSVFTGWSGESCSATGTCTVTMDAGKSVTATFEIPVEVTGFDLQQSLDETNWVSVPGDLASGFSMALDPDVVYPEYYYLTVEDVLSNRDLAEGLHPFFVDTVPDETAWFAWWNAKGVNAGAALGTWQAQMWKIINKLEPIFYLKVEKSGEVFSYRLVDGLQWDFFSNEKYLQVDGTYPLGDYTFTGTISDTLGTSSQLPVDITFKLIQYQLSVSKTGSGSGTVTSLPAGINCGTGAGCQHDFDHGTVVTLTADAATGSTFSGWNGAGCSGTSTCTVTMTETRSVTANFTIKQYTLTADKSGTGSGTVTSLPAGINCGTDCTENYNYNTVVTLTASADFGSSFTGWNGADCPGTGTCTVTITETRSLTANFTLGYKLTVSKLGNGSGTVTGIPVGIDCGITCTHYYIFNTLVRLSAVADTGSIFEGWDGEGCESVGTSPCPVTMSAARSVTATFKLDQYPLTVNKAGSGSGTVTSDPAGIDCGTDCTENYDYSTVVTLTATVDPGSTFMGWSGTDISCPGTGVCRVTMEAAKSVTATFTLILYKLNVTTEGSGTVSSIPPGIDCGGTCEHDYAYNTVVTLTAAPASGWGFFGWQEALSGNTNPITLTMDGNKLVTAVFKQYFIYLPLVSRPPVFADNFNFGAGNWDIVPDPDIRPPVPQATWWIPPAGGEFHGKHTVTNKNSKAVARVYPPQMPSSYSVEAKVKLASGSVDGSRCGLLFDFFDNTQTYRFVIMPGLLGSDNWLVQVLVAGTWNPLAVGQANLSKYQAYLLRVERQGAPTYSIKVYLDGVLLWSGSDNTYSNGRAGLNIGAETLPVSGYVEAIFDDFVIDILP
jgi:hypothetical protein